MKKAEKDHSTLFCTGYKTSKYQLPQLLAKTILDRKHSQKLFFGVPLTLSETQNTRNDAERKTLNHAIRCSIARATKPVKYPLSKSLAWIALSPEKAGRPTFGVETSTFRRTQSCTKSTTICSRCKTASNEIRTIFLSTLWNVPQGLNGSKILPKIGYFCI